MTAASGKPQVLRPEPLAVRVPEACRMIGIGRSKLYELIADGTIEVVKIGSITVIPVAQLRAIVATSSGQQ